MEKKESKKELSQNIELRTLSIAIKSRELSNKLKNILLTYHHFENTLLSLILQNYKLHKEGKDTNDFSLLTSPQLMIDALYNYMPESAQEKYLRTKYKKNKLWIALRETVLKLNLHNLAYAIKETKANFDAYFKNLEAADDQEPNLFDGMYSVELDKQHSLSFARLEKENLIGISLSHGTIYLNVNKEEKTSLMDIGRILSAKVVYNNGDLYLQIVYLKEVDKTEKDKVKYAGIDIGGTNNLMAIFVDDETTPSIIVDGKVFKEHNEKFDRIITKLSESKSKEAARLVIAEKYRFFEEQFHKMAKYVIEYLHLHGVTDLFVPKNLEESSGVKILIIELLQNIENQAQEYGINVYYIDESRTSSLNDAVNNIKVGTSKNLDWSRDKLFKLYKPIKVKSNNEFEELLKSLQNSIESK